MTWMIVAICLGTWTFVSLFLVQRRKQLAPGKCECSHNRSSHVAGKRHCVTYGCPCMIYIRCTRDESNLEELERMARL